MSQTRMRSNTCPTCGDAFQYLYPGGRYKKHCSAACRVKSQIASAAVRRKAREKLFCQTGCGRQATRTRSSLCEACYYQQRRTGSTVRIPRKRNGRYKGARGYIVVRAKGHPLANKFGFSSEHRLVAFQQHKGCCPNCYWCQTPLAWDFAVIDHLNEIKDDNRPENLVVSCNGCNRSRGALLPFLARLTPATLEAFVVCARRYHARITSVPAEARTGTHG